MSSSLTEEQRRRIEENRKRALGIREAKKQKELQSSNPVQTSSAVSLTTSSSRPRPEFGMNAAQPPYKISKPNSTVDLPFASMGALVVDKTLGERSKKIQIIDHQPIKQPTVSSYFKPQVKSSVPSNTVIKYNNQPASNTAHLSSISGVMSASSKPPQCLKITFKLESSKCISVEYPFCIAMNNVMKLFRTAVFDQKNKRWKICISEYLPLVKKLNDLKKSGELVTSIATESVPSSVVSLIVNGSTANDKEIDLTEKLDEEMIKKMFPFQREGVKFGIRRQGRCMIADEMGLGKTVQALGIAGWFKEDWPLIIVCPASVTQTWKNAALRWLSFLREDQIEVADSQKSDRFPRCSVIIMSYERMNRNLEDVLKAKPNVIILDECHNIKEEKAARTKSALELTRKAKRVILLSGTPALSRPIELLTQIRAVNPQMFTVKHDFGVRYCNASKKYMGRVQLWDYKGHSHTDELKIILESTIMIRRMKKDVLRDLPSKTRVVIELQLEMTKEEREEMEAFKQRCGDKALTAATREDLMQWYRDTSKVKINSIVKYLEKKLKTAKENRKKIIVFAHHKVVVNAITEWLHVNKISFILIVGETLPKHRQECCDAFQTRPTIRVAVVSILAAGVGITLTAAHQVIFAELFWNPGVLLQAEDRAHRIGQEENVSIEYLIAKGTADEMIWSIVGKKLNVLSKVGLASETMKGSVRSADQKIIEDYFKKISLETMKQEGVEDNSILEFADIPDEDVCEILPDSPADKAVSVSVPSPRTRDTDSIGSIGSDFPENSDVEEIEPQPGPSAINGKLRNGEGSHSDNDTEDQFPDDDTDLIDITTSPANSKGQISSPSTGNTDSGVLTNEEYNFDDMNFDDEFDKEIENLD